MPRLRDTASLASKRHPRSPAAGGELRPKTTLFARSLKREWQDARVAASLLSAMFSRENACGHSLFTHCVKSRRGL
jgi:hypothetical protein